MRNCLRWTCSGSGRDHSQCTSVKEQVVELSARNSSFHHLLEAAQDDESAETSASFPGSKGSSSHQSAQVCKYTYAWAHLTSSFTASLLKHLYWSWFVPSLRAGLGSSNEGKVVLNMNRYTGIGFFPFLPFFFFLFFSKPLHSNTFVQKYTAITGIIWK